MNTQKYYILIDKSPVEVTEEVYRAYKRPAWRERKRRQIRHDMELSMDLYIEDGLDIPSGETPVDELVQNRLLADKFYAVLDRLTDEERNLIDALFYKQMPERAFAAQIGLSQNTVNYHKKRLLEKLRKLMEE